MLIFQVTRMIEPRQHKCLKKRLDILDMRVV